jgi:hypothetical protein
MNNREKGVLSHKSATYCGGRSFINMKLPRKEHAKAVNTNGSFKEGVRMGEAPGLVFDSSFLRKISVGILFLLFAISSFAQAPAALKEEPRFLKVPELATEWQNFESRAWEKAAKLGDFKVATGEKVAPLAQQPSEVRIAQDGKNFYVRFTATDTEAAKAKSTPAPIDEFGNNFPRGDHAEIWIKNMGSIVFAFDRNGNKYEAYNYDQKFFSGFHVKSRSTASGWEAVLMIPMRSCIDVNKAPKDVGVSFVRHLDQGDGKPERSTVTGQKANAMPAIKIEW